MSILRKHVLRKSNAMKRRPQSKKFVRLNRQAGRPLQFQLRQRSRSQEYGRRQSPHVLLTYDAPLLPLSSNEIGNVTE